MKSTFFFSMLISSVISFAQPKIIFDFCSHNEETSVWDAPNYYQQNRAKLMTLATYFQQEGIKWNLQSDWTYLANVILQDTTYFPATSNKNILRYLHEDLGVEIDPHGHETQYIYPDLVYLMDSLGLPESKVMGGTLYSEENGINLWTNLIDGQNGLVFPNRFWQPDYMMGGGTPNHVADLKYYGIWNPKSETEYLVHEPANHLRHIGVGCDIKVKDETTVEEVVADLKYLVDQVQNGSYPDSGFYFQTIFFEQGSLNNTAFYQKIVDIADSTNAIVTSGLAEWLTMKEAYTKWETEFTTELYQWECGTILAVEENETSGIFIYPNPATTAIYITGLNSDVDLKIYHIDGTFTKSFETKNSSFEINTSAWPQGIYFLEFVKANGTKSVHKIIIH